MRKPYAYNARAPGRKRDLGILGSLVLTGAKLAFRPFSPLLATGGGTSATDCSLRPTRNEGWGRSKLSRHFCYSANPLACLEALTSRGDQSVKLGYVVLITAIAFVSTNEAHAIIINEIMHNPTKVPDSSGEWIEIFNQTTATIDMNGWTIKDNVRTHTIDNGGPLNIPAGGFLVFGINDDFDTNGGVVVDYEYTGIFLGNSGDQITLLDGLVELDYAVVGRATAGKSLALKDLSLDNSVPANFMSSLTSYGDGDFGTPGSKNFVSEPAALALLGLGMVGVGFSRRRLR